MCVTKEEIREIIQDEMVKYYNADRKVTDELIGDLQRQNTHYDSIHEVIIRQLDSITDLLQNVLRK